MKKVLVGCAIAAAICLMILVIVVARFGPRVFQYAKKSYSTEKEKRNFVSQWEAPTGESAVRFFPVRVGTRDRGDYTNETIELFHINKKGYHGYYGKESTKVEILIWSGDDQQRQRVCDELKAAYEKKTGSRSWLNFEYRCYYKSQDEQAHLWFLKGWLFLFYSENSPDLDLFIDSYLTAINGG